MRYSREKDCNHAISTFIWYCILLSLLSVKVCILVCQIQHLNYGYYVDFRQKFAKWLGFFNTNFWSQANWQSISSEVSCNFNFIFVSIEWKKKTSKFMIYSIQQTVFLNITIFKLNQVISNQIHIQNRESISVNQFHNRRSDIMMLYWWKLNLFVAFICLARWSFITSIFHVTMLMALLWFSIIGKRFLPYILLVWIDSRQKWIFRSGKKKNQIKSKPAIL